MGGNWVVQLVERPTLGFSSGHDLRVMGPSPALGSVLSGRVCWRFSALPLPALLGTHVVSLSLYQNHITPPPRDKAGGRAAYRDVA